MFRRLRNQRAWKTHLKREAYFAYKQGPKAAAHEGADPEAFARRYGRVLTKVWIRRDSRGRVSFSLSQTRIEDNGRKTKSFLGPDDWNDLARGVMAAQEWMEQGARLR